MKLNTLAPAPGSRQKGKRLGRGIGSGWGKTAGRGHKGQTARAGGTVRRGFEGGQTPLYRRLPKFGFFSHKSKHKLEMRLDTLASLDLAVCDLESLKACGAIPHSCRAVKIILSGECNKPLVIKGLAVSAAVQSKIQALGGSIDNPTAQAIDA